jgi:hypothetical protein
MHSLKTWAAQILIGVCIAGCGANFAATNGTSNPPPSAVSFGWQLTDENAGLQGAWARGELGEFQRPTFQESLDALPVHDTTPIPDGAVIRLRKIVVYVQSAVWDNLPAAAPKNITIDRCLIVANRRDAPFVFLGQGSVLKDSLVDGRPTFSQGAGTGVRTYQDVTDAQILRTRIIDFGLAMILDGGGVVEGVYASTSRSNAGDHTDTFTRRDGINRLDIKSSRLTCDPLDSATGPFFLQDNGIGAKNVYLSDSLVEGFNYMLQGGPETSLGVSNVRLYPHDWLTGSSRGLGYHWFAPGFQLLGWTGVYRYNPSGSFDPADVGFKGVSISAP